MNQLEKVVESLLFRSRWLLAPFFLGLIVAIFALLIIFVKELWVLVSTLLHESERTVVVSVLALVDLTLIASLLLIIMLSGYENFVSKIVAHHEDRPDWMGKVSYADLKIKLMGSIVAISAVELLRGFINMAELTNIELAWRVGIHLTFVVSGVLFAITDRIVEGPGHPPHEP